MHFRTEITAPNFPFKIAHRQRILPLGSCFSEHMAEKLRKNLFHVVDNPFGTSYNPVSLANQINRIHLNWHYSENELNQKEDRFFSFDHYTAFSGANPQQTLQQVNNALQEANNSLPKTGLLMITLGTAHAWKLKEGNIVNNCHRLPSANFDRILLSPEKIINKLSIALQKLLTDFAELNVVITVSPVRHLRDGAVANQRSKSILLVAAHELAERLDRVHYFPSYELMMDDLRDYRFYKEDMLHPTPQAVDYIWEKFSVAVLSDATRRAIKEMEPVIRYCGHQPVNPTSPEHQSGAEKMRQKMTQLKEKWPEANWSFIEEVLKERAGRFN